MGVLTTSPRFKAAAVSFIFQDDFTAANGSAIDAAKWDNKTSAGAGTTEEIQSNQWRISSTAGSYTAYARAGCIMTDTADVDILAVFTFDAVDERYVAAVARNGSWSGVKPSSGYMFRLNVGNSVSTRIEILRNTSSLATGTPSMTNYAVATPYVLRAQCVGSTLQMRVWPQASGEPGTWDLSTTDATYASGKCGLSHESGSSAVTRVTDIDYITVAAP